MLNRRARADWSQLTVLAVGVGGGWIFFSPLSHLFFLALSGRRLIIDQNTVLKSLNSKQPTNQPYQCTPFHREIQTVHK